MQVKSTSAAKAVIQTSHAIAACARCCFFCQTGVLFYVGSRQSAQQFSAVNCAYTAASAVMALVIAAVAG